jgi:methionine-S-sulfoxide reductase
MHDPTQLNRQGPDVGDSYRSAIFTFDEQQQKEAEKVLNDSQPNFKEKIVTQIVPATAFYPAEDYHQKYAEKTGRGMCHIPYEPIQK